MTTPAHLPVPQPDDPDVEVFTALIHEDVGAQTPMVAAVAVSPTKMIVGAHPDGGGFQDLFRMSALDMGMQPLVTPRDVLDVELPGWRVICGTEQGVVLDAAGVLWASGIAPFPMWRSHAHQQRGRVALYYAPGLRVPGELGEQVEGDYVQLQRLCNAGVLVGGMAPITEVPDATFATFL